MSRLAPNRPSNQGNTPSERASWQRLPLPLLVTLCLWVASGSAAGSAELQPERLARIEAMATPRLSKASIARFLRLLAGPRSSPELRRVSEEHSEQKDAQSCPPGRAPQHHRCVLRRYFLPLARAPGA